MIVNIKGVGLVLNPQAAISLTRNCQDGHKLLCSDDRRLGQNFGGDNMVAFAPEVSTEASRVTISLKEKSWSKNM